MPPSPAVLPMPPSPAVLNSYAPFSSSPSFIVLQLSSFLYAPFITLSSSPSYAPFYISPLIYLWHPHHVWSILAFVPMYLWYRAHHGQCYQMEGQRCSHRAEDTCLLLKVLSLGSGYGSAAEKPHWQTAILLKLALGSLLSVPQLPMLCVSPSLIVGAGSP